MCVSRNLVNRDNENCQGERTMVTREISINVTEKGTLAVAVYWNTGIKYRRLSGAFFASWRPVLALVARLVEDHPDTVVFVRDSL